MCKLLQNYVLWLWLLLLLAICSCSCHGAFNGRCHQWERNALLQFKQGVQDPSNRLASWTGDGDCCGWFGVICHNSTRHVLEIHLGLPTFDKLYESDEDGATRLHLSGTISSSLLDLKQLKYLNLKNNDFSGNPIPKFLGSIKGLRVLDLSGAGFGGMIPHELGNLSNLEYLNLSINNIVCDNMQWLSRLSSIKFLDLTEGDLSKASNWLEVVNSLPSLIELQLSSCALPRSSLFHVNLSSLSILDLSGNELDMSSLFSWVSGLKNLNYLSLGGNDFHGSFPNQLQNLTSLKQLDLSLSYFSSIIPDWLYSFQHLESLNLGLNRMQGSISTAISNLTSLRSLDLSHNNFVNVPIGSFKNLCNLKVLSLSQSPLGQRIDRVIEILSECIADELETLNLDECQLTGPIPISLCQFTRLRELRISDNKINGSFPFCFGSLKKLKLLSLGHNSISGPIQALGEFANLEYLNIAHNLLESDVLDVHFTNLTKLEELYAGGNKLTLRVDPNWVPPPKLRKLDLGSWKIVGSQFPGWLSSLKYLEYLDLSNTDQDMVPFWFWNMSTKFEHLNLSHNQIHGMFPNLSMPNAAVLDLSNNSFIGSLFHFLCLKEHELSSLFILHLGDNHLSGEIPDCWKNWPGLSFLNLGNNRFSGHIPDSIRYLTILEHLHLQQNNLSGEIPISMQYCGNDFRGLITLDLSKNEFMGNIPAWIGNMSEMAILNLRDNKYSGHLPREICDAKNIQILDLAKNYLSGPLPACISQFWAMVRTNESNHNLASENLYQDDSSPYGTTQLSDSISQIMKGRLVEYSTILPFVKSMDLSSNRFTGRVPNEITSLRGLQSLNLSHNFLRGGIPQDIGAMRSLESIDFSQNQLSGEIPRSISSLTFLSFLNLSFNDLEGKIPVGTQLQSFDPSSFIGNKLCGLPLDKDCNAHANQNGMSSLENHASENGDGDGDGDEFNWLYLSVALGFIVGFWSVMGPLFFIRSWRHKYYQCLEDFWGNFGLQKLKTICFFSSKT